LHKVTRSKGKGGSSFSNSTATVAQIEVETAGFVFSSATPDILREAFYQSMIPEVLHKQVWLHTVVVHNDGTIFVKPNALYLQAVVAEQANRNKAPPTPGRGKKAQAKGKGFK